MRRINDSYYKDVDKQDLIDGACKGLVAGLGDPYSSYMTNEEYENWKSSATGEYSGIGVTFSQDKNGNYIIVGVAKIPRPRKPDSNPETISLRWTVRPMTIWT